MPQQQQQIVINVDQQPVLTCPKCNQTKFVQLVQLHYIAPFVAGNAKAAAIPHPHKVSFQCAKCKKVFNTQADLIDERKDPSKPLHIQANG